MEPAGRTTTRPAVERLRGVLDWAIRDGREVPGLLSTGDLQALAAVLRAGAPLPVGQYPKLRLLAQILWRVQLPGGARYSLGDALEAVGELTPREDAWPFRSAVDPLSFRDLSYARNAEGLDREYDANREGWDDHGRSARRFVCDALRQVSGHEVAWVLGAGRAYDLPLGELGERFRRVVLVDIDRRALEATLDTVDLPLRHRFELVAADLTGVAATFRTRAIDAMHLARSPRAAAERLSALMASYRVDDQRPWRELGERADLIVSQMVLSQLNEPFERFAGQVYRRRFDALMLERHPTLDVANMLFAHRVQHDHLRFLRRYAAAAVLTSDVSEQYTRRGPGGAVELVGDEMLLLGAYRLAERVPAGFDLVHEGEWHWHRVVPRGPGELGSRMRVGALLLRSQADFV